MEKYYDSAVIRNADKIAVEKLRIPGIVLMENAGRGAAEILIRRYAPAKKWVIFCGPGNNGGDGFVLARHLLLAGFSPKVFAACAAGKYSGDALAAMRCARNCGIDIAESEKYRDKELSAAVSQADVTVDALLGTGSNGAPRGEAERIIPLINKARLVAALDLPSGVNPDTGTAEGVFVKADTTVTFLALKKGFASEQGRQACGKLLVCHIGAPADLLLPKTPAKISPA